jgi:ATP-dependent Clp protease ATP-binding subunit ClpB
VSAAWVRAELEKLRSGEGRRMESASGDKMYGRNLIEQAGKLNPVIGHDEEISRVLRILSRRNKKNPVLIGEPSMGKTGVMEGLT